MIHMNKDENEIRNSFPWRVNGTKLNSKFTRFKLVTVERRTSATESEFSLKALPSNYEELYPQRNSERFLSIHIYWFQSISVFISEVFPLSYDRVLQKTSKYMYLKVWKLHSRLLWFCKYSWMTITTCYQVTIQLNWLLVFIKQSSSIFKCCV